MTVRYLGAAGYLISRDGDAILTAPFFSNPSLIRTALFPIKSIEERMDRFLPEIARVSAILVGHGHHDHLMDLPYLARVHAPGATIFCGPTAARNLAECLPKSRVETLDRPASNQAPGEWRYVNEGRIRFMAIRSGHAPHVLGLTFYKGSRETDAADCPKWARDWKSGTPYAYLIDFMRGDEVVFRIYYQDSATAWPDGRPPPLLLGDRAPIDLAILCVASFNRVKHYPEWMVRETRARAYVLGHWEDFFRRYDRPPRVVRLTDADIFLQRFLAVNGDSARWDMPAPGVVLTYEPE